MTLLLVGNLKRGSTVRASWGGDYLYELYQRRTRRGIQGRVTENILVFGSGI